MLGARDFKRQALDGLKGRWLLGVGTGVAASALGAATVFTLGSQNYIWDICEIIIKMFPQEMRTAILMLILAYSLVLFVIGGPITLGYVKFNLGLVDKKESKFEDLFLQFKRFGAGFQVQFLRNLYLILWEMCFFFIGFVLALMSSILNSFVGGAVGSFFWLLLLADVFAGLIFAYYKLYSYAMAPYILCENPHMSANDAITKSKEMMEGNRWRLFCLRFSFVGWLILCLIVPLGVVVGFWWLKPYMEASFAAFYKELIREQTWHEDDLPGWMQEEA